MPIFSSIPGQDDQDGLDHTYPFSMRERPGPSKRDIAMAVFVVALVVTLVLVVVRIQSEQARTINCGDNLRQIGEALMLYAQDSDDSFPNRLTGWPSSAKTWTEQEAYTWRVAIRPYLHSPKEFRCLSNPRNTIPTGCTIVGVCSADLAPDGFDISYACNFVPSEPKLGGQPRGFCGDKRESPVSYHSIQAPSSMIAVVEDEAVWSEFDVLSPSFQSQLFTGHNGFSNYLFADGHVSTLHPSDTIANSNMWLSSGTAFAGDEQAISRRVLGATR